MANVRSPRLPEPTTVTDIKTKEYIHRLIQTLNSYFLSLDLQVNLSASGTRNTTTVSSTPTTVSLTDDILLVDASSSLVELTLPPVASSVGRTFTIIKVDNSGNTVQISGDSSGETLNGSVSQSITTQYTALSFYCDGSEWRIV